MADSFSPRNYMKEINKILKEHGSETVKMEPVTYQACPACGGEWLIPMMRIPKAGLAAFALNMEQKYRCAKCSTEVEIEL